MSRPYSSRSSPSPGSFFKVNGKIRAREVRVIGVDGKQLGVMSLNEALAQARANAVDLVEIAPTAAPPVCRIVDYGKFRYEQSKKDRESKKHQHASLVKEIQLTARIDPHDLAVKLGHAIDFLCEDMKVKAVLKFRGREMQHTEFGFQVMNKFLADLAAFGHPDFETKLNGRTITVMISPLPRAKRAKNPREGGESAGTAGLAFPVPLPPAPKAGSPPPANTHPVKTAPPQRRPAGPETPFSETRSSGFVNNPFDQLEIK